MRAILTILAAGAIGALFSAAPASAAGDPTAIVLSPKQPLNVRSGPAIWNPRVGTLANGSRITVVCQVFGQKITEGTARVTDAWDRLPDGTYVSDAWLSRTGTVPLCSQAPVTASTTNMPATVSSGAIPLKGRSAPSRESRQLAAYPNGTALGLVCQQRGQAILGSVRITDRWDRLADGSYVSDAYVRRAATPPPCESLAAAGATAATATSAVGTWVHPLPGFKAGHSFRTAAQPNHIGVDIMSFTGTPIRAAAAGTVVAVVCNIDPAHSCDQPGSALVRGCGWYVKLQHPGGISTIYCHLLKRAPVQVGQQVSPGEVIGYVGSSGNSSFPHLHFEVHTNSPPTGPANAVDPWLFMAARGVSLDH